MRNLFLSFLFSVFTIVFSFEMNLSPADIDSLQLDCLARDNHLFGENVKIETEKFPTGKRNLFHADVHFIYVTGCFLKPVKDDPLSVRYTLVTEGSVKKFGKRDGLANVQYVSSKGEIVAEFIGEMENDGRVMGTLELYKGLSLLDSNRKNCMDFYQYSGHFGQAGKLEQFIFGATGLGRVMIKVPISLQLVSIEANWNNGLLNSNSLKMIDEEMVEIPQEGNFQERVITVGYDHDTFTGITYDLNSQTHLFYGNLMRMIEEKPENYFGYFDLRTNKISKGVAKYTDGSVYIGSFKRKLRHDDEGKLTFPDGLTMEGKFRQGLFTEGKVTYQNGNTYQGEYRQKNEQDYGCRHGVGTLKIRAHGKTSSRKIQGRFKDNHLVFGTTKYADQSKFRGRMQRVNGKTVRLHGVYTFPRILDAKEGEFFRKVYRGYFDSAGSFLGPDVQGNGKLEYTDGYVELYKNGISQNPR